MGRNLWFDALIYIPFHSTQCCMKYGVILDLVITALDCTMFPVKGFSLQRYSGLQGVQRSGKSQGNSIPGKSQGIDSEFCYGSGKLWKVREKSGNLERVMAMVVSWVIWNILDNILIHCWWSWWHECLGSQAPMIHWIFHWCQISWYTIFPVTIYGNYSLHMKLKGFGTPCLQICFIVIIIRAIILFLFPVGALN